MIKFLRYVLNQHNNITEAIDWLSPATFSTGSHTTIGYPWEIYRSDSVLPNSTRAVTFYTKGGGLVEYFSYSIVLPVYDLAIFMVSASEDVTTLNQVFGAVVQPLAQAAEVIAQTELKDNYAGQFTAAAANKSSSGCNDASSSLYNPQLNSSMTLAQSPDKSLYVEAWISNSTDALSTFVGLAGVQSGEGANIYFQLIPTFETRDEDGCSNRIGEVWRFINVRPNDPNSTVQGYNPQGIWNDYCIANFDPLYYAGVPLNEVVLWRDNSTSKVQEIELSAFLIRLGRA